MNDASLNDGSPAINPESKQKKKPLVYVLAAVLIILIVVFATSYSSKDLLKKCTFQFKHIEINGMDFGSNKVKGTITLSVNNPNWLSLNVKSLKCKVNMGDNTLVKGNTTDSINLPARTKTDIEIPFKASYANLSLNDLKSLFRDNEKVLVTGKAVLETFFISFPVTFKTEKDIKKIL
ncbi:MAG: LEA type 2 family protein [Candidatus Schekmanbacteria bacterium]|nr:LEA type 2 family protein [Candidatus Schekmanbacteria bacterium]